MRRSGGYNNQTAVIHNNPHGHHQNHHRLPNRMYHQQQQQQQPPPLNQPQQLLPYGHNVSNPRPLNSFPSPNSLNPQQQQQLYSTGPPGLLGSGGGVGGIGLGGNNLSGPPHPLQLIPPSSSSSSSGTGINPNNSSHSSTGCNPSTFSSLSSGIQSSGVVGGDMPPVGKSLKMQNNIGDFKELYSVVVVSSPIGLWFMLQKLS